MPTPRRTLGQQAEDLVATRLCQAGYAILARNWRHGQLGELDIVARRHREIVFVEVRSRRGPLDQAVAAAIESVNARKQARLVALAEAFLAAHDLTDVMWHISVAAVGCQGRTLALEVIGDAVTW